MQQLPKGTHSAKHFGTYSTKTPDSIVSIYRQSLGIHHFAILCPFQQESMKTIALLVLSTTREERGSLHHCSVLKHNPV